MRFWGLFLCCGAFAVAFGQTAHGADAASRGYPFQGQFTVAHDEAGESPLDPKRCGLSFFTQEADGRFTGYHVDLVEFAASRKVRYVRYQNGVCIHDANWKIELCSVSFDTDPDTQGRVFIDAIDSIDDRYVRAKSFETLEQAHAYASKGNSEGASLLTYYKCGFDTRKLKAAMSDETSKLPIEERAVLTAPDDDILARPETAEIARSVGLLP